MAGNTNYYQVLDLAGVQQLWDACKATFVRTVNGNGIDANGNVQISVAGDFQVNGSSVVANGVANINTESAYNASTNKIATMADVSAVLLWENASPNSSFASQTLSSLPDMSKFKYIVFEVKRSYDNTDYNTYKIPYGINNFFNSSFMVYARYLYGRTGKIASATSIQIENGYFGDISSGNSGSNNDMCIITKIYGTNVL